jgi:hypothetical protein
MWAVLTVVLVVAMCATPLALLFRDIAQLLRRPAGRTEPTVAAFPPAPSAPVLYVASRPVQPLR